MNLLIIFLSTALSGCIGWYLDQKVGFDIKPIYWILGYISGYIAAFYHI